MGKQIDISARLTNERPTLKLAEGKVYEIDDRKNTVLVLNQKIEKTDLSDLSKLDEILELVLGKDAIKDISEMDLSFTDYQTIFVAVMAGAMGEDFEVVEARFQQARTAL